MKIPTNLLQHITSELESLDYGSVTIEVSNNGKTMDVITERRQRFNAHEGGSDGKAHLIKQGEKSYHQG